jgi:hypothetical protein
MIIYKEGDASKGPCNKCKMLVSTTFRYAPYDFKGHSIPDILQGFCDTCGAPVSIPHQSSFKIKEFRERVSHQVEVRVPSHYTDILIAIGTVHKVSKKPNFLCRIVAEHYLLKANRPDGLMIRRRIVDALKDALSEGKSKDRLSCVFPDTTYNALMSISEEEKRSSSTIVKGIIVAAKHDLLDNSNSKFAKEFEELAAARL